MPPMATSAVNHGILIGPFLLKRSVETLDPVPFCWACVQVTHSKKENLPPLELLQEPSACLPAELSRATPEEALQWRSATQEAS
jgi:hypothetical protein